jgi:multicomponent Na+:H+ antiporter subunit F
MIDLLVVLTAVAIALSIARLVAGPTAADRVVALDVLFAAALGLCIAAAWVTARTVFLDVGIGLAVVGFVATAAWARLIDRTSPNLPGDSPQK